jgi:enoyl-ACP reductase-like protein
MPGSHCRPAREAGDKTKLDRIAADAEDDRDGHGRSFGRDRKGRGAERRDHGDTTARPYGILVNALLVGFIESDQWVQRAVKLGVPLADFLAKMGKEVRMGRVGTAEEFANAACFLASDAASLHHRHRHQLGRQRSPVV